MVVFDATWGQTNLQLAVEDLRAGRPQAAVARLNALIVDEPGNPETRRLLGLALTEAGNLPAGEAALRTALGIDQRSPAANADLGLNLAAQGRGAEAEAALYAALTLDPFFSPAISRLVDLLIARGAADEALRVTQPAVNSPIATLGVLTAHSEVLKSLGRLDEAVEILRRGVHEAPHNAIAQHNLAAALIDSERFAEADDAARLAREKGFDGPQAWRLSGQALQGLSRFDDAEAAYREAARRRSDDADAIGDLADLIWMRTGDIGRSTAELDRAIAINPGAWPLLRRKAKLLEYAGDSEGAYKVLAEAARQADSSPMPDVLASQLLVRFDAAGALQHAERAFRRAPEDMVVLSTLCQANLSFGRPEKAVAIAEALKARAPNDQYATTLLADSWRAAGDPRCRALLNVDQLVAVSTIETPLGWRNLEAFLSDLAASLSSLMTLQAHPVGQSLRRGVQTQQSLNHSTDPVIKAFFKAIDAPIRQFTGDPRDAGRQQGGPGYRFNGAWAARLKPNGYHANHIHPLGRVSSAFYVQVPDAVDIGHQGWLKFCEPDAPAIPALRALRYVKPEPGRLVLFPSYMWHGTEPFSGEQERLTIAFDLLAA